MNWRRRSADFNTPRLEKNLALVNSFASSAKSTESSPAWWRWLTRCTILL